MGKYPVNKNAETALKQIEAAKSFDGLAAWFSDLFMLGGAWNMKLAEIRLADLVRDRADKVEPGTLEALHVRGAVFGLRREMRIADELKPEEADKLKLKTAKKSMSFDQENELAYSHFKQKGHEIIQSVTGFDAKKLNTIAKRIELAKRSIEKSHKEIDCSFKEARREIQGTEEYRVKEQVFIQRIQDVWEAARVENRKSYENSDLSYVERDKLRKDLSRKARKEERQIKKEWQRWVDETLKDLDVRKNKQVEKQTRLQAKKIERLEFERANFLEMVERNILNRVLNNSPISEEKAREWVEKHVFIESGAVARMKRTKSHYSDIEQVKADMAEFYRLVGGKVGAVKLVNKGVSRAHANRRTLEIAIDSRFDKRTLFHEMGHHVEFADPVIYMAADHFRKSRSGGKGPVSLRRMSNRAYGANEVAVPDSFFDPYVGKMYQDSSSEVISMGLQQLASPEHVLDLLSRDPEHLEMVLGIATYSDPVIDAWIENNRNLAQASIEQDQKRDSWEKELKRVASSTALAAYLPGKRKAGEYPVLEPSMKKHRSSVTYLNELDEERISRFETAQDARNFLYLLEGSQKGLFKKDLAMFQINAAVKGYRDSIPEWFDGKLPKLTDAPNG